MVSAKSTVANASDSDVRQAYLVLLGRGPESDPVVDEKVGMAPPELVSAFLDSDEFRVGIAGALTADLDIGDRFDGELTPSVRSWAASFLPLDEETKSVLEGAETWAGFLSAIWGDPKLQQCSSSGRSQLAELASIVADAAPSPGRSTKSRIRSAIRDEKVREWMTIAADTGLFDADYYRAAAPSIGTDVDPLYHYCSRGFRSFFNPGPDFDEVSFLAQTKDRDLSVPGLVQFAKLRRERTQQGAEPQFDKSGLCAWLEPGPPRPDAAVTVERLRGYQFFERYGFAFEGGSKVSYPELAVQHLASRRPAGLFAPGAPSVSIIIPVYGQLPFVLNCLDSLSAQESPPAFEIIIYDDKSPTDDKVELLREIPWVHYRSGDKNLGFLRACNAGVEGATGEFVVLLNSDVRVTPDWLAALLRTFEDHPKAGLVGSKLFNADGSLQEAGGLIWRDASGYNFGRDDDPGRPEYCYARQVDYCSGAAIGLRRSLWADLHGFDEQFAPAYYEDVDLAFRVRREGLETWYQPLAKVIHYEGKTHGRSTDFGVKAHQIINAKTFAKLWRLELQNQPLPASQKPLITDGVDVPRLLIFDANIPTPDQDAGSAVTIAMIETFREMGWSITFCGLHNLAFDPVYTARLQELGVEVLYAPYIESVEDVLSYREGSYDAVLALRHTVLYPIYQQIRSSLPLARLLFHNIDLHYLRMEREAALTRNRRLRSLAESVHDEEAFLVANSDCTIITSHAEEEVIRAEINAARLVKFSYIAEPQPAERGFEERFDILFFGGYQHPPNLDAALVLAREIWPLIRDRLPEAANLVIAGSNMPATLRELYGHRLRTVGFVPDLRSLMEQSRLFVSPLRYGAGVKGKLITSLANGLPSICSPITIEGTGIQPGRDCISVETTQEFAEAILRLYNDRQQWSKLQTAGYDFIRRNYSRAAARERCEEALAIADEHWVSQRRRRRQLELSESW